MEREDTINRQEVLEQINCWIGNGEYRYTNATHYLTERINSLPPVTPQPKIGHWVDCAEREPWFRCSECKEKVWGGYYKYCPNCGAKMKGE